MRKMTLPFILATTVLVSYLFLNIRISEESVVGGVTALVTMQSIIFGIYTVSLSIIAALHDTKLIRKLLRPNTTSRAEIQSINNSVFIANLISLVLLISFLFLHELIIENILLITLFHFLIPFFAVLSLIYIYDFFKIINASLFKHGDHE